MCVCASTNIYAYVHALERTRIHTKLALGPKLLVGLLTYRRSQSNETDTLRQHVHWAQAHCQVKNSFFEPSLFGGDSPVDI